MEKSKKQQFYALWQLDILIDISIHNISMLLVPYVEFKGLVSTEDQPLLYVDGIFLAGKSDKRGIGYIETEFGVEEDIEESLIEIIGTKYSNNNSLIDKNLTITANNSKDLDLKMYSYDEFIEVISKIGIPLFHSESPIPTKQFIYNVKQINQKSNFTVNEASSIASNWVISNNVGAYPQMTIEQSQLQKHNTDILCECIRGHNQQGFHLITKALWIKSVYECYEESSRQYPNSTQLTVGSTLDLDLTIISKNEFIRWCEFMDIDTGLTIDDEVENESIEFLKIEIERLRNIPPQPIAHPQSQVKNQDNEVKINIRTTDKTILISLGLMAWMLSTKSSKLSRASKPNCAQIEEAIKLAVSELDIINPDNDNHGIVVTNLARDISLATKQLNITLNL